MSNYSFETSLPAHRLNELTNKQRQCDDVLLFIRKGANNLLQISELTGIPQSTVSARVNDLCAEGRVKYDGYVIYNNMKRKRICLIVKVKVVQNSLF